MNYKEILEQIDILDDICDRIMQNFDNEWFSTDSRFKSFEEYENKKTEACGKNLQDLIQLSRQERMMRPIELNDLPSYGNVMPLKDFIDCVKCGDFIDYDGYGSYVKDGKESNIEIYPSDVKNKLIRPEFDTIIWYNR